MRTAVLGSGGAASAAKSAGHAAAAEPAPTLPSKGVSRNAAALAPNSDLALARGVHAARRDDCGPLDSAVSGASARFSKTSKRAKPAGSTAFASALTSATTRATTFARLTPAPTKTASTLATAQPTALAPEPTATAVQPTASTAHAPNW